MQNARPKARLWLCAFGCTMGVNMMAQTSDAEGFFEDFSSMDDAQWHRAHYQFNHPAFDTDWSRAHVFANGSLRLKLAPQSGENRFLGASIRRQTPTHYGRYEAMLTAARGHGVITGFFLYTGPAYGAQHDEIDWEIFGQDTTTAQIAWFTDGTLHSQSIALGFDAAGGPNMYTIEWSADRIQWSVNGDVVFETREDIPHTPQRLFTNIWAADPSLQDWAGLAKSNTIAEAQIHHLRFLPETTADLLVLN